MDTYLPEWSDNNVGLASTVVAAAGTQDILIDMDGIDTDLAVVQVQVIFGGAPDGDTTIDVLHSADGGVTLDTEAESTTTVGFGAAATKRVSVKLYESPYSVLRVTNNNTAQSITIEATYSRRIWREYKGDGNKTSTKFSS